MDGWAMTIVCNFIPLFNIFYLSCIVYLIVYGWKTNRQNKNQQQIDIDQTEVAQLGARTVVVINGLGGVGKSEFIFQCSKWVDDHNEDIYIKELSTVDFVKEIAFLCGWRGGKSAEDRVFLSDLKKAMEKYNDMPIKLLKKDIITPFPKEFKSGIFFVNARESSDLQKIKLFCNENNFQFYSLYIKNDSINSNEVPELVNGIVEAEENCDFLINNCGTIEDLYSDAGNFIESIKGKYDQ